VADGSWPGAGARLAALALALWVPAAGLKAQAPEARLAWGLDSLRAGFCLHFLMDPAAARATPFRRSDFVPLAEAGGVHPSLQVAAQDAQYATWTPSAICAYQFASTRRGRRVQRNGNKSQVVGVWRLASRPGEPVPVQLMASSFDLAKQLSRPSIRVVLMRAATGKVPESEDRTLSIEVDRKTHISWNGTWVPDSSQAVGPATETWRLEGTENSHWTAQVAFQPAEALLMVGSVQVRGKTDLARLLQASPIRWAGPFYRGGSGEISFFR
jgi:hypothetical protein